MAFSSHQPNDIVQCCTTLDNTHFFKVVLADALKEQKLEIPKKFVRQYGLRAFLNNQICLKVADGREWNVGLTKSDGRVWLHLGWQKFIEFYSIRFEYFLVFKYEQYSRFHVVIFDLTATEIEYPEKKSHLDEATEGTDLDHDLDPVFHPQPQALDFKDGKVSFSTDEPMHGGRKLASTTSQRARAMAKASTFQSKTLNPSFMCKIWPTNIQGISLTVPRRFAEMHLEEATRIILQVSDGRMWDTRCHFCGTSRRVASLRNGWKNFVVDNSLHVGDACVFEMITKNSRRISFKVQIFRAS